MQQVVSTVASPIDGFYFVENVTNHRVEEHLSQSNRGEEAKSYVSSDGNKGTNPSWHEEASNESESDSYILESNNEDDAKTCYPSDGEDNESFFPSSYEL